MALTFETKRLIGAGRDVSPTPMTSRFSLIRTVRCKSVASAVRLMRTSLRYLYPTFRSGREKATPLGERGGARQLEAGALVETAFLT